MIGKEEFYRGAALAILLEDKRCDNLRHYGNNRYVANGCFFYTRYTTKARSPWIFSITGNDYLQFGLKERFTNKKMLLVLICGGDGVCALTFDEVEKLLNGYTGSISVRRQHNSQYTVTGGNGKLKGKIPLSRWPGIVFEDKL